MFDTIIGRRIAAFACTLLMSSACVLSAVGPAQVGTGTAAAAMAARVTA